MAENEINAELESKIKEGIAREHEIEKNKREAIDIAAKIFEIISNPEIVKITTPDERHKMCIEKNKNFAQAFPLVLSKMSRDLAYNEKAFRKFLDKLHKDPGQGMDGVIERQADYAMYLYQEQCKVAGRHYSQKIAQQVRSFELQHMSRWAKDIKKREVSAKNEYAEENKKALNERKKEFLDFVADLPHDQQFTGDIDTIMKQDQEYLEMLKTTAEPTSDIGDPDSVQPPGGYSETQAPVPMSDDVRSALSQREAILKVQSHNDWLQDSNLSNWKKTQRHRKK